MKDTPLLIKALKNEAIERPPVWLMRQAGRYMKEYRDLKEKYTFLELCQSPELATEVTLQPIKAFSPDAAILFADILLPFTSLGLEIDFNPGPVIQNPIRTPEDVNALKQIPIEKTCPFTQKIISNLKSELPNYLEPKSNALIGFSGAPWTLACYAIDQTPYKHFAGTKVFAAKHKKSFIELLDKITQVIEDYLLLQIEAGIDAVQIFDSWAGILPKEQYLELAYPPLLRLIENIKKKNIPIILYSGSSSHLFDSLLETGADSISIDSTQDLSAAFKLAKGKASIQGNLDPALLFSSPEEVEKLTQNMLDLRPKDAGYIANLGHGILQKTPVSSVKAMIDCVKNN